MSLEVVSLATRTFGDVTAAVDSGHIGTAEFNRPPDNFFDADLIGSLADAYEWLCGDGLRAIVLTSVGKNFCAGADFTGRSEQGRSEQGRSMQGRSEQGRSEQGRSEQGRSEQGRSEQGRSEQGRSEQGRSEQGRSEQDPSMQGRSRQA